MRPRLLESEGVDTVFGIPGAAILPFCKALLGSSIRHITVRHEEGGTHAADGYSRATGRIGVCAGTSGPAGTNMVTGLSPRLRTQCRSSRSPAGAGRPVEEARTLQVEPVNDKDVAGFFLPTTADTIRLLDEVADPSVRLQFDVYHVQSMEGDVTTRLRALLPRIAHVQVADNPGRHQPGTAELDFPFLFDELDQLGYDGFVGLEYVPEPDTAGSLTWREQLKSTV
ncbi:MAG: thiamine pyrophosphate-binding protein [Solirubrobacteraceae bacterium]